MKIVSWNLRCPWDTDDGKNCTMFRVGYAYDKIQKEKPDVIAFQEIRQVTLDCLKKMLPEYEFFGSMRTATYTEEGLYVAYRKDTCALMGGEVFWLSPTPYVAGSRFENQSSCCRICTMAKIRDLKTNECYRIWDNHLDHISDEARQEGLKCLFEFIKHFSVMDNTPHVILGDFNAFPESETMLWCEKQEGFTDVSKGFQTTFHGFGKRNDAKIDYIYVSNELKDKVEKTELWTDNRDGIYLSDHYPVCMYLK